MVIAMCMDLRHLVEAPFSHNRRSSKLALRFSVPAQPLQDRDVSE
jgi:hypothetical protein